jgi:polyketide cyclase/dehydrase/lipid transport protein
VTAAHELERTVVLSAAPQQVWDLVGDFHALADWHPRISPSTPDEDGAVRVFRVEGKVVARERLLARDADARSYTYALLDPMLPISDFVATLAVLPHRSGGTEVVWSARYRGADAVVPQVEALFGDGTYAAGLNALAARFG